MYRLYFTADGEERVFEDPVDDGLIPMASNAINALNDNFDKIDDLHDLVYFDSVGNYQGTLPVHVFFRILSNGKVISLFSTEWKKNESEISDLWSEIG